MSGSDMPRPRPYDRRIPDRHPGGRTCQQPIAGLAMVVIAVVFALAGCGPVDANNAPVTPIHGAGLGQQH